MGFFSFFLIACGLYILASAVVNGVLNWIRFLIGLALVLIALGLFWPNIYV